MNITCLDENLQLIYIQEDLKKISEDKIKKIFSMLKGVNIANVEGIKRNLPDVSYNNVISYIKKSKSIYNNFLKEKQSRSDLQNELKDIRDITISSLKSLRQQMEFKNSSKVSIIDRILIRIHNLFSKYGKLSLTVGILIKIVAKLGFYFFELYHTFPELLIIFNVAAKLAPLAIYGIIGGILLLLIAYILKLIIEKKEKDRNVPRSYGKNPYETEE